MRVQNALHTFLDIAHHQLARPGAEIPALLPAPGLDPGGKGA